MRTLFLILLFPTISFSQIHKIIINDSAQLLESVVGVDRALVEVGDIFRLDDVIYDVVDVYYIEWPGCWTYELEGQLNIQGIEDDIECEVLSRGLDTYFFYNTNCEG